MKYSRRREERLRRRLLNGKQPISRLFPNMITIGGMCCGLSAIRFAMLGRFEISVMFIIAAAIIDGMDGRIARMLGATSDFGAQLDSLSDFLCFGVAPALVVYMWQLNEVKGIGWAVVLFFSVCVALRLARFNTDLFNYDKQKWEKEFFVGMPSPAGGILCLIPVILHIQTDRYFIMPHFVTIGYMVIIATLMASRIPTFSGKNIKISHEWIPKFMIFFSFMLVFFIIEPWIFISTLGIVYLCSIFFSVKQYKNLEKQHATQQIPANEK
ncbi:MAG: phosphatidylcholine/phosphatidylserine synthase [Rickettsiales bacterium]